MKLRGAWLSGPVQRLFDVLEDAGAAVYFVGGCVRNALLGVPIGDVDLATDAHPETVTELAQKAGLKVIPTGLSHGTVTVVVDGPSFEITTFRTDVETDGRHAVVAFSRDVATDAARRDFTMNAIYARRDGSLLDPLGGLEDVKARRVRFIGSAPARIREDALRILRFFRFIAAYGDPDQGIDPDGLAACAASSALLGDLSAERITAETRKLLSARDPGPAVAAMAQSGVLAQVLPGASADMLPPLVHVEAGRAPRWERRLAAMGGLAVAQNLRLSNAQTRHLTAMQAIAEEGLLPRRAAYAYGAAPALDAGLLLGALSGSPPEGLDAQAEEGAALRLPIRAADLVDEIPPGPELGAVMRRLEAAWIASDFALTRTELAHLARES